MQTTSAENFIEVDDMGGVVVLHIVGHFDIHNLSIVEKAWNDQVKKRPSVIAINCSRLCSLDSSAIGAIVKFFNFATSKNILLVFCDLTPVIRKLFITAKLNHFFNITSGKKFKKRYVNNMLQPHCHAQ
jgi:anti-anti-sigma factor